MKTKDKIVLTSLELFNEKGERNVSTNHIAAHMGMSPGNLYYHFRNKSDIIYEIFKNYELMVDSYLNVPTDRAIHIHDLISYLDAVFNGLWAYRFIHQDLEHLLSLFGGYTANYSSDGRQSDISSYGRSTAKIQSLEYLVDCD